MFNVEYRMPNVQPQQELVKRQGKGKRSLIIHNLETSLEAAESDFESEAILDAAPNIRTWDEVPEHHSVSSQNWRAYRMDIIINHFERCADEVTTLQTASKE